MDGPSLFNVLEAALVFKALAIVHLGRIALGHLDLAQFTLGSAHIVLAHIDVTANAVVDILRVVEILHCEIPPNILTDRSAWVGLLPSAAHLNGVFTNFRKQSALIFRVHA